MLVAFFKLNDTLPVGNGVPLVYVTKAVQLTLSFHLASVTVNDSIFTPGLITSNVYPSSPVE